MSDPRLLLRAGKFPELVRHGFTTRAGGVSTGRYASLNLGGKWGDDPKAVARNAEIVAHAGAFTHDALVRVRQVHGACVLRVSQVNADSEADGLWMTREEAGGRVIGVMTADCVPVLIVDTRGRVVAAIHSGWRGTVSGIVGEAVSRMTTDTGVGPEDLVAAIGPCIEPDAFEVGDEVAAQFPARFVARDLAGRAHVDLVGCVRAQLVTVGLLASAIERVGACTYANAESYFSYRRDGQTGQHLSFIGFEP